MRRYWWMFLAMIPVGMILGLFVAGVITFFMPRSFDSEGIIEVTQPPSIAPPEKRLKPRSFSELEVGRIADPDILGIVADALELPAAWTMQRDEVVRELRKSVTCKMIPDTNLISVRVNCGKKQDARDIALEILGRYHERASRPSDPEMAKTLSELREQIHEQNLRVSASRDAIPSRPSTFGAVDGLDDLNGEAEFEKNVRLLEDLEKKMQVLEKSILPTLPTITLHQLPQIPEKVASPNVRLNLLIGLSAGLVASPLLTLPVVALVNRRRQRRIIEPAPPPPPPEKTVSPEDEW